MRSDPPLSDDLQSASPAAARAWVSLGGNLAWNGLLGADLFEAAMDKLEVGGFRIRARSALWTGPAWPDPSDPAFYNAVVEGAWTGRPDALMQLLLDVERAFGRTRSQKNAPRTLDLDLLDVEGAQGVFAGDLILPHPRLTQRAFILGPLAEAAPAWRDQKTGLSALDLFELIENKQNYSPMSEARLGFGRNLAKT
ncbi:MAG: 2-amino-4-hydroxy-6-hydroxymethyldihydropteridine diphosphokinase [Caulobacterales bacterium]